jgi:hypothetical protein
MLSVTESPTFTIGCGLEVSRVKLGVAWETMVRGKTSMMPQKLPLPPILTIGVPVGAELLAVRVITLLWPIGKDVGLNVAEIPVGRFDANKFIVSVELVAETADTVEVTLPPCTTVAG